MNPQPQTSTQAHAAGEIATRNQRTGEPRVKATCCVDEITDNGYEVKITPRLYCRACCPVCREVA